MSKEVSLVKKQCDDRAWARTAVFLPDNDKKQCNWKNVERSLMPVTLILLSLEDYTEA